MRFGAHVSIAGGIDRAPIRAYEIGCDCFQIFTRSPRGGEPPKLDKKTVDSFLKECSKYGLLEYYVHTPYYINLASENQHIRKNSINIIKDEMRRASILAAKYVMTHIGSSKNLNKAEANRLVIEGLGRILDKSDHETNLLIENSAGQGGTIGNSFEELAGILAKVGVAELGICLDTAHLLASGYDIRTKNELDSVLKRFSNLIGLDRLRLLHGNDSKVGLGERKDRHEHIGLGHIGLKGFRSIVNHPELIHLNLIVETPLKDIDDDIRNLKNLKNLKRLKRSSS